MSGKRESAIEVFEGTNIIMVDGFRVLGSVIGTPSACDIYMESEIEKTTTIFWPRTRLELTTRVCNFQRSDQVVQIS